MRNLGSFCAWAWPMRGGIALKRFLSLAKPWPRMIPGHDPISDYHLTSTITTYFVIFLSSPVLINRNCRSGSTRITRSSTKSVSLRLQTHNRHPKFHPHGQAMGCLSWGFRRKCYYGTALYLEPSHHHRQKLCCIRSVIFGCFSRW